MIYADGVQARAPFNLSCMNVGPHWTMVHCLLVHVHVLTVHTECTCLGEVG